MYIIINSVNLMSFLRWIQLFIDLMLTRLRKLAPTFYAAKSDLIYLTKSVESSSFVSYKYFFNYSLSLIKVYNLF